MAKRASCDLATIQASLPPSPQAGRLQKLVQDKLTDERLGAVVDRLMLKAEGGDTKALDYLLTLGGFKTTAPASITVNQFFDGELAEAPIPVANRAETRPPAATPLQAISLYLAHSGPQVPEVIASNLQLSTDDVVKVLDSHPTRFGVDGKQYFLNGSHRA